MRVPLVYLAGPITGLSYDAATNWRVKVRRALLPDIHALSPMRDLEVVLGGEDELGDGNEGHLLATDEGIFERDAFDIRRSDLVLFNLLDAKAPSKGTLWEMGYACALNKPRIVVMEPSGNPHDSIFVRCSISVRTDNLPEAVEVVRSFLSAG